MLTHLVFDFFGTLVDYSPSRTEQGYAASHRLLLDAGARLDYAAFLALWDAVADGFEREASHTLAEYSMHDVCGALLRRALGRVPDAGLLDHFVGTYLSEWNTGVVYWPELPALLERLSRRYRLGVITNTHHKSFVPDHLRAMGVDGLFDAVVTSIGFGHRKPAPPIFGHALAALGARADASLYVGDSFEADYCGARDAGLRPLLIDPDAFADVPAAHRLDHVLALEKHLEAHPPC